MKFSVIPATSIFALAASWSAHAYVVTLMPDGPSLYDLVPAGDTASVPAALRVDESDKRQAGFTGPVDRSAAAGRAFPLVPLGAAPGAPPDGDFATPFAGTWRWNASQKALAIGVARIAPLIGTIDSGNSPDRKPFSTVFVARSSLTDLNERAKRRRSGTVNALAPSSTSTATVTVTGPANLRLRAGAGFAVPAPNNDEPVQAANEPAATTPEPPAQLYRYAPQAGAAAKGNLAAASFGDAASGGAPLTYKPAIPASGQAGTPSRRTNLRPTGEGAAIDARLIDVTLPIPGQTNANWADGTRTFLPASVSANPAASANRYVTSVLDTAFANKAAQSVEAFRIGPGMAAAALTGVTADAVDPLRGKIMAGVGPLDNSLALP